MQAGCGALPWAGREKPALDHRVESLDKSVPGLLMEVGLSKVFGWSRLQELGFFSLITPSSRCWLMARQAESQADKASLSSTSSCSFLQPHPCTPMSHIKPSRGLGQVSAMGWQDRAGWGDNKRGFRWTNKLVAMGCPMQAPHEPT